MLPVQLVIRPAILLSIHLPILLSIGSSILLSVFPAIVLPVLLPIGAAVFLPNVELRKCDRRDHRRCRDGYNQAGDQSCFQHRVIHHNSSFCERVWCWCDGWLFLKGAAPALSSDGTLQSTCHGVRRREKGKVNGCYGVNPET
jgi:hypothetical protein